MVDSSLGRRGVRRLASVFTENRPIGILAVAIVSVGLALRLSIAWQDLETLTVKVLPDDAFYYFLTADRISNGQNISFDGVTPSNGYHPLWLFFLVPLYLLPGKSLPLHLALTASSVFDVAAGSLVALAVARLTGNKAAALFALTFYLFIPQNIFAAVNGVESALASMLLAALLLTLVSVWRQSRDDWIRWSVVTGVLGGLTVLARLEGALVLAAVLALVAVFQSGAQRWRAPLAAGVIAAIVVAPWFLWSLFTLGTVMPVSAESTTWLWREHFSASHPDADIVDKVRQGLSYTRSVLFTRLPDLYFPARPFAAVLLAGVALLSGHFLFLSKGLLRRKTASQILVAGLPLAAFAVMLLFNSSYRWSVRAWYFAWGMPMAALFIGVIFAYLDGVMASSALFSGRHLQAVAGGARQPLLYAALVALLVLAFVGPGRDSWRTGHYPFQRNNLEAAMYLRSKTEAGVRVASFNAGVIGYFSDRTVINIDGVVNPDAYHAYREHRLLDYLRRVNATFVADRDLAWRSLRAYIRPDDWSQSLWGEDPNRSFVTVEKIGFESTLGQMRIWRLIR